MKHNHNQIQLSRGGMIFRRSVDYVLLVVLMLAFFYALSAFAADGSVVKAMGDVVEPPPGFEWLGSLIVFMKTLPYIGPVLVNVLKYVGAIAAVFTALSTAASVVLKIPELMARWAGAAALADKIKKFHDQVKPWLDYLSIFNAKK